jgi:hypothetical protein
VNDDLFLTPVVNKVDDDLFSSKLVIIVHFVIVHLAGLKDAGARKRGSA